MCGVLYRNKKKLPHRSSNAHVRSLGVNAGVAVSPLPPSLCYSLCLSSYALVLLCLCVASAQRPSWPFWAHGPLSREPLQFTQSSGEPASVPRVPVWDCPLCLLGNSHAAPSYRRSIRRAVLETCPREAEAREGREVTATRSRALRALLFMPSSPWCVP